MATIKKVGVLGCGAWATAIADLVAENGHSTSIWCHRPEIADAINQNRENFFSHPGHRLSDNLTADTELERFFAESDAIIFCIASSYIDSVVEMGKYFKKGTPVLSLTKGVLEDKSSIYVSDFLIKHFVDCQLGVLSGPNLASEVVAKLPAATVIASAHSGVSKTFQRLITNGRFRVYTSADVRGVELGGILKNIMAIAAGTIDGLSLGANAKASLLTRCIPEMIRLGTALGANAETFHGLSGFGDLVATCASSKSRNWQIGNGLAKGNSLSAIQKQATTVAEGIKTTRIIHKLALEKGIEMPITAEVYRLLFEDKAPHNAIKDLMSREIKAEQ
ncbi:MAG: glycerol-3-phosphate dehydrogenase (NAD(P)+) [Candidatus Marinamargulisbacteria bacterium]|jgi:glycerol-3-phosphate dehydrogenase (NAD(P)+)